MTWWRWHPPWSCSWRPWSRTGIGTWTSSSWWWWWWWTLMVTWPRGNIKLLIWKEVSISYHTHDKPQQTAASYTQQFTLHHKWVKNSKKRVYFFIILFQSKHFSLLEWISQWHKMSRKKYWSGKLKLSSDFCVFWYSRVSTKPMRDPCMPNMRSVDPVTLQLWASL